MLVRCVLQAAAQLDRERHVDVGDERVVGGRRLRLGHPARDRLLQPGELVDLDLALRATLAALLLLRVAVALRRLLDVRLHDPPRRPRSRDRLELDARLLREPPCDRRCLDALAVAAVRVVGRGLLLACIRFGLLVVFAFALGFVGLVAFVVLGVLGVAGLVLIRVAVVVIRRLRLFLVLRLLVVGLTRLVLGVRVAVVARSAALRRVADLRDRLADRERVALLREDLDERAVAVGVVGHVRLVGLDLDQRLALLDLAALLDEPLQDRALLHRVGQPRHHHLGGHQASPNVDRTAFTISSSPGIAACSSGFEYGIGTSAPDTRITGASSQSNACSWISAARLVAAPPCGQPSSTTTARFVFFTDWMIVCRSSGRSVRGSITSASSSCSDASVSAASSAVTAIREIPTTVTSWPSP